MALTGELIIAKNAVGHTTKLAQDSGSPLAAALKIQHTQLDSLIVDLQKSVLGLRVLPLRQVFQRFPRLIREMSVKLARPVIFAKARYRADRYSKRTSSHRRSSLRTLAACLAQRDGPRRRTDRTADRAGQGVDGDDFAARAAGRVRMSSWKWKTTAAGSTSSKCGKKRSSAAIVSADALASYTDARGDRADLFAGILDGVGHFRHIRTRGRHGRRARGRSKISAAGSRSKVARTTAASCGLCCRSA